jgi:sulfonate transport system substrate-binding protein
MCRGSLQSSGFRSAYRVVYTEVPAIVKKYLGLIGIVAGLLLGSGPVLAGSADDVVLRVGDQKGGLKALMDAAGELNGVPYRVEWDIFAAASPLLEALNADAIDAGVVGDAPFVFAYAAGSQIRVVMVMRFDERADAAIALLVPKDSPVRTPGDLKGRTVTTIRGSAGHYFLLKVLQKANVNPADVKLAYLSPMDSRAALNSGSVDAWSTWDPYVALTQAQDSVRTLADGHGLFQFYGYFAASVSAIKNKRQALQDFDRRVRRAYLWSSQNVDAYAAVWAKETGLPPDIARTIRRRQIPVPTAIDADVIAALKERVDVYHAAGVIGTVPDISAAFDRSLQPTSPR